MFRGVLFSDESVPMRLQCDKTAILLPIKTVVATLCRQASHNCSLTAAVDKRTQTTLQNNCHGPGRQPQTNWDTSDSVYSPKNYQAPTLRFKVPRWRVPGISWKLIPSNCQYVCSKASIRKGGAAAKIAKMLPTA